MQNTSAALRPFYFIVVLWGEQFRKYFTEYCLPSLLAPLNIPVLNNNAHNKFLICTTPDDWTLIQKEHSFVKLKDYIEPVFIEISLPTKNVSSCQHMGIGHKIATNICHQNRAYGIALTPDLLLSNGTLDAVQKQALQGAQIVYCAALRFSEEPFFQGLLNNGFIHPNEVDRTCMSLTGRELVKLAIPAMHSQTLSYDFETPYFASNAPAVFWRMKKDGGILLHSLSWCPLLLDYGIVTQHDTTALEEWTMDGNYVFLNFKEAKNIYVCEDSDEMMLVSWSPESYNAVVLKPGFFRSHFKGLRSYLNGAILRGALENSLFDPLKVKLFPTAVRWHTQDLTPEWDKMGHVAQKLIRPGLDGKIFFHGSRYLRPLLAFDYLGYCQILIAALKGKTWAWKKIFCRFKKILGST